jgi:hypothetical protein
MILLQQIHVEIALNNLSSVCTAGDKSRAWVAKRVAQFFYSEENKGSSVVTL